MVSRKTKNISPFIAMDILEASQEIVRSGHDVIPFSLGEPDFPAPQVVKKACIKAIQNNLTKYTHSQGLIELREAICRHYFKRYNVKITPDRIIVTPGTSPAFGLVFSALIEKGDEIILPNPYYPCDKNFIEFHDGKAKLLELSEANGFHWDVLSLKKILTQKTRGIFVTSPSNPTGVVLSADEYQGLARTGKTLVSDEIYHGLSYGVKEHSALEFTDNCFVINGFSKAYAMTGFRLGYVIAPAKYIRAMQKVQQNFNISVTTFVQHAGIAALEDAGDYVRKMRDEYQSRRDLMLKGLKKIGFPIRYTPEGAFYILAKIPDTVPKKFRKNSYKLAFDILNKSRVAVTPGIDFGSAAEGYLRFSYAVKPRLIREGLSRLEKYFHG